MAWEERHTKIDNQLEQILPNGNSTERAPFLAEGIKTVSLTSWEAQKLPNNELDFKGISKGKITFRPQCDKWKIVFFIFLLHGLGTLMPWNMFITAKQYFVDFKLDIQNEENSNDYAKNFLQYIGFASQIPNLVFNWLNVFVNLSGDLTQRIVYSLLVEIIIFIVTVVLAMLDTANWPGLFFWITMISVVVLNMANGIYQNSVYGMAARLPVKYTGAVVLGSNISGVFATIISIASTYMLKSQRTSAIYYFITAMLILLLCFDTYFALPLNRFFRHHEMMSGKEGGGAIVKTEEGRPPYWTIFKQAFPQLFNIFFTFFVTLALFPAIHSDIKRSNEDFFISDSHFTAITCFLTFNFFAMLGSLASSFYQLPNPKFLVVPVVFRIVFLPLFIVCNYQPKGVHRVLPVLIFNEWIYWVIAILMSFSSGYLSSLGMMYAPQAVSHKYQVTAGMFAAAMLVTGIFSGILFSMLLPFVVANLSF